MIAFLLLDAVCYCDARRIIITCIIICECELVVVVDSIGASEGMIG